MRDRLRISPQLYATVSLVALGALALIVLTGAGVRLTGSGLGCPDWPKCYGGTTPPLETHAVIEYGNRLLTGFVGFAVIAASVLAWFRVPFRWHLAFFGALLPLGVIGQAILGALVVKYHLAPGLVMSHFILSMLLLDASFALAWCSRYEPWERRRSSDRLGVWSVRALIPLGQLTIAAGTVATASGPHAGAHAGQLVHRFQDPGMGCPAPLGDRHRLRPRRDRRLVPSAPPKRGQEGAEATERDDWPNGPTGRRRRCPVGSEAAGRNRLGPRRPGNRYLAGDALDGGNCGTAGASFERERGRGESRGQ
jgi:heme A synthase